MFVSGVFPADKAGNTPKNRGSSRPINLSEFQKYWTPPEIGSILGNEEGNKDQIRIFKPV